MSTATIDRQPSPAPATVTRTCGSKRRVRAVVGITLLVTWALSTVTGVLLELAPDVRRAGQQTLLGVTQHTWGDLHWWVSVAAVAVTVVHLVLDWRTFRGCLRTLAHRPG